VNEPHYHINLFWSDDDSLWVADVPDLPGCMTHGATRAEALANAAEAIEGWIETANDTNLPVPAPRYRPAIYAARDAA
jgi:predicted RNase H-like HicB family nuclease